VKCFSNKENCKNKQNYCIQMVHLGGRLVKCFSNKENCKNKQNCCIQMVHYPTMEKNTKYWHINIHEPFILITVAWLVEVTTD
jgi:hypothetical protein